MTSAPVLTARDVAGAPPGVAEPAIRNVTLELLPGSWIGVTGPNGAGKTTLALTLAGLWTLKAGTLDWGTAEATGERVRVATVLQEPATQLTQRSVREEIAFTALNLGSPPAQAAELAVRWAERFELLELLDQPPQTLSAGQQQRVLLAAALASEPQVLLLDEAAAHLDDAARALALDLVREQVRAGLAVLWITQEPVELERADSVWSMTPDGLVPAGSGAVPAGLAAVIPARAEGAGAVRLRVQVVPTSGSPMRVRVAGPIAFDVGGRGTWAILGPNGSGKSSLLEAIAGVDTLPGVTTEWRQPALPGPLLVGQYPERQIFEELVGPELMFAATRRGRDPEAARAEAISLLGRFGMPAVMWERRTWSLSAGEKRIIAIVGASIAPAPILLLDEPTCGLDPGRRRLLATLVLELAKRIPVVIATQDRAFSREVQAIEVCLGLAVTPGATGSAKNAKYQQKNGLTEACSSA